MPLFTWSKDYAVGVKSLDSQHTNLFAILNELLEAMAAGKGQSVAGELLRKLVSYTKEHFATEERLMELAHYPALAAHREHHRALTQQVGDFMTRFEKGDGAVNLDLLEFLRAWLKNHIQREDKEYGPWLNDHGVH
jgi:hemerythrin